MSESTITQAAREAAYRDGYQDGSAPLKAAIEAAYREGLEAALAHVVTTRTREQHGPNCACTTCEFNEAEDDIRALAEKQP